MNKRVSFVGWMFTGLLLLTGCGGKGAPTPPQDGFTCRATAQYREMTVEGQLTCAMDGGVSLTFSVPKSLQGITLGYDDAGMTMSLGKMQVEIPAEQVPQSALIGCLSQVLTAEHGAGTLTDEGYVLTGRIEDFSYTLVCDPQTGMPVSLTVPDQELTVTFAEAAPLEN